MPPKCQEPGEGVERGVHSHARNADQLVGAYDPDDLRVELVGLASDRAEIDAQIERVRIALRSGCEHNGIVYNTPYRKGILATFVPLWRCAECFTEHHGWDNPFSREHVVELSWDDFIDRRPPGRLYKGPFAAGRSEAETHQKEEGTDVA